MINSSDTDADPDGRRLNAIVERGPGGAIALAGIATAIVVAIWFAFYLFVFIPRGMPQ